MSNPFHLKAISNIQIEHYYKNNPYFGGIYMKDEIPRLQHQKFYIINLDSSTGNGTHWVLVYNVAPDEIFYFDPMGIPYPPRNVLDAMRKTKKPATFNIDDIQSMRSESCGYYCMFIADHALMEDQFYINFKKLIHKYFSYNNWKGEVENEKILEEYFHKKIK